MQAGFPEYFTGSQTTYDIKTMTITDTLELHRRQLRQAEQFIGRHSDFLELRPDAWLSLGRISGARIDFDASDIPAIVREFGSDGWQRILNGLRIHYHFIKNIDGVEVRICEAEQADAQPKPVRFDEEELEVIAA